MDINMEIPSSFTTKDFNLAAFLWSFKKDDKKAQLSKYDTIQEGNSKAVLYFTFLLPATKEEVNTLVMSYYNGACQVEPKEFTSAQGRLKDLIHSQRN